MAKTKPEATPAAPAQHDPEAETRTNPLSSEKPRSALVVVEVRDPQTFAGLARVLGLSAEQERRLFPHGYARLSLTVGDDLQVTGSVVPW